MSSQVSASTSAQVREMAAILFEFIETQINRAGTKAGLILAADTLVASTVAALHRGRRVNVFDDTLPPLIRLTAFLTIPMFLALLVSAIYALIVARPILRLTKRERTFYFFGRIAETSAPEFITSFSAQSPGEIRE